MCICTVIVMLRVRIVDLFFICFGGGGGGGVCGC